MFLTGLPRQFQEDFLEVADGGVYGLILFLAHIFFI